VFFFNFEFLIKARFVTFSCTWQIHFLWLSDWYYEPFGSIIILSPYSFPFQCCVFILLFESLSHHLGVSGWWDCVLCLDEHSGLPITNIIICYKCTYQLLPLYSNKEAYNSLWSVLELNSKSIPAVAQWYLT